MNKPKHTPGPWIVETPMGDDILCIMQASKPINVATWVAQIGLGKGSECDPSYDEAHANARLLAVAPELLAILTELVEHIDLCDEDKLLKLDEDPHPPSVFRVLGHAAKKAIQKATRAEPANT